MMLQSAPCGATVPVAPHPTRQSGGYHVCLLEPAFSSQSPGADKLRLSHRPAPTQPPLQRQRWRRPPPRARGLPARLPVALTSGPRPALWHSRPAARPSA
eukprot:CAMPEP_0175213718 /NCGR_PEP_ID=MMETSP0093-20121207/16335_1 /TAXON_ID=311494 /ORGANISM="Alexandrium monilatum, Strain CCMP3105" /LENGTH=99 /DNA_ID=CAMNT_0016507047 /DNA_START=35 /DNA_END=330 /DNA_ORIENTATION=+